MVALEDFRGQLPVTALLRCRLAGVRVEEAATFFERLTGKILIRDLRPSWFVFSEGFEKPAFVGKTKRLVELVVAALALVVLAPFLAVLWRLIKLDSRGPGLLSARSGWARRAASSTSSSSGPCARTPKPPRVRSGPSATATRG